MSGDPEQEYFGDGMVEQIVIAGQPVCRSLRIGQGSPALPIYSSVGYVVLGGVKVLAACLVRYEGIYG
jgi:hypothetical protein